MNEGETSNEHAKRLREAIGHDRPILYVITAPELRSPAYYRSFVVAVARGGADVVQFRIKPDLGSLDAPFRTELEAAATAFAEAARRARVVSIINDDPKLASIAGADGVHVGASDVGIADCRRLCGGALLIGATARSPDAIRSAAELGADYVGCGPVFEARATKPDAAEPIGVAALSLLSQTGQSVGVPVIAIGGIDVARSQACIAAGASGVAVVRAVARSDDPEGATRSFRRAIDVPASSSGRC